MYYCYLDTPIGELLLAGDDDALCLVSFPEGSMRRDPEPDWIYNEKPFAAARHQLTEYFAGERKKFDLPLKLSGTEFQMSVLHAVRRDDVVLRYRRTHRPAKGRAGGGCRKRPQPGTDHRAVSPRDRQPRRFDGIRRRAGHEGGAAAPRSRTLAVSERGLTAGGNPARFRLELAPLQALHDSGRRDAVD